MQGLARLIGLLAVTAFMGCGNTDLNKDLKPIEPTAKQFKPQEGIPANPGMDAGSKTQKVITK